MKATHANNKGVYNLNPTAAVMKQGSKMERQRPAPTREDGPRMPLAHEAAADTQMAGGESHVNDFYGMENRIHNPSHPAMQTRASHARNQRHADGRTHEDHHHAVRMAKGK